MTTTIIDLIRHGEPVGGRKYRGQVDDPLSPEGFRQMWAAVGEAPPWASIVSSPLSRCAVFAAALADRHGIALRLDARLQEAGFGAWEGRTPGEIEAEDASALAAFKRDPVNHRPEGAEPAEAFAQRVGLALDEAAAEFSGRHALLVCHAGVIRMALVRALAIPLSSAYRIEVPLASVTRLAVRQQAAGAVMNLVFHGMPQLA
ncbi:MAG: histidine phosphatase family protein [Betaproteobacteria bacterium]|nr:histidine phosphatase family protein [Betaproteobacteria bacterium]